jgi:hypothetical protein
VGCELSRVVLADFAQLSPTRSVTVTQGGLTFLKTVTVIGRAPLAGGTTANTLETPSNTVKVFVEQQDTRLADPDHADLSWSKIGAETTLIGSHTDTNEWKWTGDIVVPRSSSPLRITIHEYENIKADNAAHSNLVDSTRLVFTESIPTTPFIPID